MATVVACVSTPKKIQSISHLLEKSTNEHESEKLEKQLIEIIQDPLEEPEIQNMAMQSLRYGKGSSASEFLLSFLLSPKREIAYQAADILKKRRDTRIIEKLLAFQEKTLSPDIVPFAISGYSDEQLKPYLLVYIKKLNALDFTIRNLQLYYPILRHINAPFDQKETEELFTYAQNLYTVRVHSLHKGAIQYQPYFELIEKFFNQPISIDHLLSLPIEECHYELGVRIISYLASMPNKTLQENKQKIVTRFELFPTYEISLRISIEALLSQILTDGERTALVTQILQRSSEHLSEQEILRLLQFTKSKSDLFQLLWDKKLYRSLDVWVHLSQERWEAEGHKENHFLLMTEYIHADTQAFKHVFKNQRHLSQTSIIFKTKDSTYYYLEGSWNEEKRKSELKLYTLKKSALAQHQNELVVDDIEHNRELYIFHKKGNFQYHDNPVLKERVINYSDIELKWNYP